MKKFLLKYYSLIPLFLLCSFYTFLATDFPVHDFANYYFGGKLLTQGNFNSNIYFPYEFNKSISDLGYQNIFASYAPNTPFLAILFTPFSWFSVAKAKFIFNCISVILFIYSIFRLSFFYKIKPGYVILIPLLFFVPIKNDLLFGQVYLLLFFLLSEFILAYEKKQLAKASLFLSLAIFLKVSPILLVLFFLFQKQFKPLFYTFGISFLLLVFSIVFTGFNVWEFYINSVLTKSFNGEIATAYVDNYQSVFMFLKRLFIYDSVENPHPFFHANSLFLAVVFAFKVSVLILGYFISKKKSSSLYHYSYWILAMVLLSPYGSTYTFIVFLIPFISILKSEISYTKLTLLFSMLFLVNNLPLSFFIEKNFPFSYLRLFLLIILFVVFIVFIFQKSVLIKSIVFGGIAFFLGTFFHQVKTQKSENFLANESPILIFDYTIKNKALTYFYWNENGVNQQSITLKRNDFIELEIKNNQIFYRQRQYTFDKSNKIKPILINHKTILYLSDYNRGIGFYTLRKIKIN